MVDFNLELVGKLCIHGFNHLANGIVKVLQEVRQLFSLIATRNSFELDAILMPQLSSFFGADIGFIADHVQVCVAFQKFCANRKVGGMSRRKLKIEDHAATRFPGGGRYPGCVSR